MVIELEPGVWMSEGEGDPPRTLNKEYAYEFRTMESAIKALKMARQFRAFEKAQIQGNRPISIGDFKVC